MQEEKETLNTKENETITGSTTKDDKNETISATEETPKQITNGNPSSGDSSDGNDETSSVADEPQPDSTSPQPDSTEPASTPVSTTKHTGESGADDKDMECGDVEQGDVEEKGESSGQTSNNVDMLKTKLEAFLEWCTLNGLAMSNKVGVDYEGTSHRYGMKAKEDIRKGETLFKIPRKLLLDPDSGTLSAPLQEYDIWLQTIGRSLDESSGWVPLLITLMYEFKKDDSFWRPYLDLIPDTKGFGHPLFWKEEVIKRELSGMTLLYDLLEDRKNIEEEYKVFVLPFLLRNAELANRIETFDMNLFKRMIAFVMAYSFSEDQESPSMIPMADMLNHHSNNNANLIFERNALKMISCRKIDKGEEIFNTFGKLGNPELLQMYGYTEDDNSFDTFTIQVQVFMDCIEEEKVVSSSYIQAMSALLHKSEIAMSFDFFVFDKKGMRRGPDFVHFLKIIHMKEDEFETMLKKRAGNRPDSFYQKLLRKLRLSKKTDTSSGVAVIDITEDDDPPPPSSSAKRSIECEEIEDNEEGSENEEDTPPPPKKQCLYDGGDSCPSGDNLPLKHFETPSEKLNHYAASLGNGVEGKTNGLSEPIVIDDDDDDEEEDEADNEAISESEVLANADVETDNIEIESVSTGEAQKNESSDTYEENPEEDKMKDIDIKTKTNCDDDDTNSEKDKESTTLDDEKEKDVSNTSSVAIVEEGTDTCKEKETDPRKEITKYDREKGETEGSLDDADVDVKDDKSTPLEGDGSSSNELKEEGKVEKIDLEESMEKEEEEESGDKDEEENDDVEIVSEEIRCIHTYEQLKTLLSAQWKNTIKKVLEKQLSNMKNDDDVIEDLAKETFTRDEYNAYIVRQGQRHLIRTFMKCL
eukprot:TCONS_00018965-protein